MAHRPDPARQLPKGTRTVAVAVFVSPHGFGHAARACAVMQALHGLDPGTRFEIFTLVPEWFFADSLTCPFAHHAEPTDVGLVQKTSLLEDPEETLRQLRGFLPFPTDRVEALARTLRALACRLAVCDISPLGIAAAKRAGVPSVLVENFTWDWIYEPYSIRFPAYSTVIGTLAEVFEGATARIQTEPVCRPDPRFRSVPPVSRRPRTAPHLVRERLGVPEAVPLVLLTMGGIPWRHASLRRLEEASGALFVVPGAADRWERRGALLALPHRAGVYHPDLVHASDAVVGKLGYSTVAEAFAARVPFAFVSRPTFRESESLAAFARTHMPAVEVTPGELEAGTWVDRVPALLGRGKARGDRRNGARSAASAIHHLLGRG